MCPQRCSVRNNNLFGSFCELYTAVFKLFSFILKILSICHKISTQFDTRSLYWYVTFIYQCMPKFHVVIDWTPYGAEKDDKSVQQR